MRHLELSNSDKTAYVDDEDFDRLNNYKWADNKGSIYRSFWTGLGVRHVSLPQEILRRPGIMFDHADRNYYNNQKYNLREANYTQNSVNKEKRKHPALTSKYKGVSKRNRKNPWRARIMIGKKEITLGTFATEVEAAKEYDRAAVEFFKEFACLNFPNEN